MLRLVIWTSEKAVATSDRLLDAIRASQLIGGYLYSTSQYLQAYIITGTSARLAISCGLHEISSTVFSEVVRESPGLNGNEKQPFGKQRVSRYWAIPAPKDPIDLGERIAVLLVSHLYGEVP